MSISSLFHSKEKLTRYIGPRDFDIEKFLSKALDIVFPGMTRMYFANESELEAYTDQHLDDFRSCLNKFISDKEFINLIIRSYFQELGSISQLILSDANALLAGDPAAQNIGEIILSYPGLYAIATYRIAHFFYKLKVPLYPRMLAEAAHTKTGIDIHPGAIIGKSLFIDHGTGVVIGETAIIGNNVKIYQGVTLGALSVEKEMANKKRHPTILDNCIIYAHATILGGETIIGEGSLIGGNVWLTKSIPANSIVYHRSEVKLDKKKGFNQEEELSYEI